MAQTIGSLDTAPYFAQLTTAIAEHQDAAEAQIAALQAAIAAVEGDTAWMMKSVYDEGGENRDVFKAMPHLYKATFLLDSWSDGTQTATLTPMDGGPAVTTDSVLYSGVMCEQTDVQATNETLQDTLTVINGGDLTLGDGTLSAKIFESVSSDIEVIVQIKQGGV